MLDLPAAGGPTTYKMVGVDDGGLDLAEWRLVILWRSLVSRYDASSNLNDFNGVFNLDSNSCSSSYHLSECDGDCDGVSPFCLLSVSWSEGMYGDFGLVPMVILVKRWESPSSGQYVATPFPRK